MNTVLAASGQLLTRRDVIVQIEPKVVGLEVAADIYGVSADTIATLQDDDDFPLVRIGRRRLVPIAAADAWIAERTQQGSAA